MRIGGFTLATAIIAGLSTMQLHAEITSAEEREIAVRILRLGWQDAGVTSQGVEALRKARPDVVILANPSGIHK